MYVRVWERERLGKNGMTTTVVVGGARVDEQQFILKTFLSSKKNYIYILLYMHIYTYTSARVQWRNVVFYFCFNVSHPTLYTSSGLMAERIIFRLEWPRAQAAWVISIRKTITRYICALLQKRDFWAIIKRLNPYCAACELYEPEYIYTYIMYNLLLLISLVYS